VKSEGEIEVPGESEFHVISAQVALLKAEKNYLEERCETFRKVNNLERMGVQREFTVKHIEQELHQLELYGAKLRNQKKKLRQAIDFTVTNLATFGVSAPVSPTLPKVNVPCSAGFAQTVPMIPLFGPRFSSLSRTH
jgi:hypothetical protein